MQRGKNYDYNFILQDLNKNKIVKLLKGAMGSNKFSLIEIFANMRKQMKKNIQILMTV